MTGKGKAGLACLVAAAIVAARALRHLRREDFQGKSVVITGGSRGLGLELARLFAVEGASVSILARKAASLEKAVRELRSYGLDAKGYRCDVSVQREVEATIHKIMKDRGRIDVLVNNAGTIQVGPREHLELSDYREAMDIYAWGPLYAIGAVVPHMRREGGGRIVNISSIGGLVAVPHLLAYCMGKFALTGLSDGTRAELARHGIRVTTVAPGLMRTGSHLNAYFKGQHEKEFAWFSLSGACPVFSIPVEKAARRIIDACRFGDARLILTLPAKLLHVGNALFPSAVAFGTKAAARLLPKPAGPDGDVIRPGRECRSHLAPTLLTRLADQAAEVNNEL